MKSVLEYLEDSAGKYPEKLAVCDESNNMTYIQLQQCAKKIGTAISTITKQCVRKPIVVYIDRRIESIKAFIGVAYSGNFMYQ